MRALILAAGLGSRLGPLSDERPKPLLPVCGVPVIRYGLSLLAAAGVTEVMVNLHHRGDLIEQELGSAAAGLGVHYSREPEILGTGGGIRQAAAWLTRGGRERFLVMNGKLVMDLDVAALLAADAARGAEATLVVRDVPDPDRWGAVETDHRSVHRIIGRGRPAATSADPSAALHKWMFTGVHVLGPSIVARLPEGASCIIRQGYLPALEAGADLAFVEATGYFEEHSTPRRYLDGNLALLSGAARLAHPPAALVGVDPAAHVAADAEVIGPCRILAGARIGDGARVGPGVVVDAGAEVAPSAVVRQAVLWPGARAAGDIHSAIVTPRGVFAV